VATFAQLFHGYSKAYGQSRLLKPDDNGKVQHQASTNRGEPTLAHYATHLNGTGPGLGIIMLQDDDTCCFGAIDYDNKKMDHLKAYESLQRLKLPLLLCRSKSGGGHFYCFTTAPVPAATMRERLAEWASLLGMSARTELFPKQSARFNDNDLGSWINLPYYNAVATERYAYVNGQPASLDVFLAAAKAVAVDPERMETPAQEADELLFKEGPPCLQVLHSQGGFVEGTRNDGMMAVIAYLQLRYPDTWESYVDQYNTEMAQLPSMELVQLIKSNGKKAAQSKPYRYACKKAPLVDFCQRRKCLHREFGIGDGPTDGKNYQIGALTRYDNSTGDEPMWRMEVNGKPIMVSNSQFYSRDEMNRACMAQANCLPIRMTPAKWLTYLGELIQTADVVPVPEDASPTGQLWEWIENFMYQNVSAIDKEEVWMGKPYREEGKVFFRSSDLFRYLNARKIPFKSEQAVWQLLRKRGGSTEEWHIGKNWANVWVLPVSRVVDEDLDEAPLVQKVNFGVRDDEF
jgi:hypothetical protein